MVRQAWYNICQCVYTYHKIFSDVPKPGHADTLQMPSFVWIGLLFSSAAFCSSKIDCISHKELVVLCFHLHVQFKIDDCNHDLTALTNPKATELGLWLRPQRLGVICSGRVFCWCWLSFGLRNFRNWDLIYVDYVVMSTLANSRQDVLINRIHWEIVQGRIYRCSTGPPQCYVVIKSGCVQYSLQQISVLGLFKQFGVINWNK